MQKKQLEALITEWEMSHRPYDPMTHWVAFLRKIKDADDDTTIYIRYIGMAKGGTTAWKRFDDDLKNRKCGVLGAFLQAITNQYPDVLQNSQVSEILGATIPSLPPIHAEIRDDRERVLIALFDRNVSLNQQGGGYYPSYTPKESDHRLFAKLNTKFFDTFARMVDTDPLDRYEVRHNVTEWVRKVERFALQNPIETRTHVFPLTETYLEDVVKRQAMPATIKGKPLLVVLGKDITLEDFKGENTFLSGNSRSGKLTSDMLARVHQFENQFGQPHLQPFVEGQFPFIDVYPFIGQLATEGCVELAREYFADTMPRIVVTLSQKVSSWVASNFVHGRGLVYYPNLLR